MFVPVSGSGGYSNSDCRLQQNMIITLLCGFYRHDKLATGRRAAIMATYCEHTALCGRSVEESKIGYWPTASNFELKVSVGNPSELMAHLNNPVLKHVLHILHLLPSW